VYNAVAEDNLSKKSYVGLVARLGLHKKSQADFAEHLKNVKLGLT